MNKFGLWQVTQLSNGSFAAYREIAPYFFVTAKTVEEVNKKAALELSAHTKVTGKAATFDKKTVG